MDSRGERNEAAQVRVGGLRQEDEELDMGDDVGREVVGELEVRTLARVVIEWRKRSRDGEWVRVSF